MEIQIIHSKIHEIRGLVTSNTNWSQIVTSSKKHRGDAYAPFAFTEQGVAMLSGVLRSPKAILANIAIMRAFVELRRYALTYAELAQKIAEMEARTGKELEDINDVLRWLGEENQARYDEIQALQLGDEPPADWEDRARIGFRKDI